MFWDLFIFREHSTWEPAYRRVTYFILRAYTQEPQLTQEKIGRGFRKNAGEWTGRVEISREEIPGSTRGMHDNTLTYSRL